MSEMEIVELDCAAPLEIRYSLGHHPHDKF